MNTMTQEARDAQLHATVDRIMLADQLSHRPNAAPLRLAKPVAD